MDKDKLQQNSIKPKIGLCLYGRFNNRYSNTSGVEGAEYIFSQIIEKYEKDYDIDVFIFSNDLENRDIILGTYKNYIKQSVFEPALNFSNILATNSIDTSMFKAIEGFRTAENTLSFMYSRKQSLELMKHYELKQEQKYLAAICCRFDLAQIDKHNGKQPFLVSHINFSPDYNLDYLYSASWNQLNCGYADQWFFSKPEILYKLSYMYEYVLDNLKENSNYLREIEVGVFDSDSSDEFSNQMLLQDDVKSKKLVRVPRKLGINNHLLHKYFFRDLGLYEISKFTSDFQNIAHILYTHSDYKDVWPVYFGQQEKYFNSFQQNYVFVDKLSPEIPANYRQIVYEDHLPYVDRLLSCLTLVSEEVIFFDHEDMFLYGYPKMENLLEFSMNIASNNSNNRGFDCIKLIRGGKHFSRRLFHRSSIRTLFRFSPWLFSIQPSFWNKSSFLQLLLLHRGENIWDFEGNAQKTVKRLKLKIGIPAEKTSKRGRLHWDSNVYPFIATAIVKGKWNFIEYGLLLNQILKCYDVDPEVRGSLSYLEK